MLSRRAVMMGVAASAIVPSPSRARMGDSGRQAALRAALLRPDTLAYYAAKLGMLFGNMIGRGSLADTNYVQTMRRECSLVCATLISASVTRRSQSGFDFKLGDEQVAFAKKNHLALDGGFLVVHGDEPAWITPTTDRSTALAELQRIVTTTMTRYAGQLDYWIVVNEAVSPKGLRNCTWLSTIGPDYIAQAFRAARLVAPDAILVLSDNSLESQGMDHKRAATLDLVTSLVKDGVPIDALGMQSHLSADTPIDVVALDSFLKSIHDLGLKIIITEMDVVDVNVAPDIGARDSAVAQTFSDFLKPLLRHPGVTSISVWGLSDNYSWFNSSNTPALLRRQDGFPSRGTLLDDDLRRKPAYFAVRSALDAAAR